MHPTQHRRHLRALSLIAFLSLGDAASAVPQMATSMSASLAVTQPGASEPVTTAELDEPPAAAYPRELYAGRDDDGVPRYIQRAFSDDERRLLREQFGIEEPARLYLSDTLPGASLVYDSAVRPAFERLLASARQAGFRVRVTESRRSAERQAYLLTLDGHLTHTATSRHADGFAVDVVVDDGNLRNPVTRKHWIAFRRWVLAR